ncbi:leucine--tRNA ligase, mitochondrial [[Candida] railenensis]|uniref:leucine--tRNA ligase n=1 Tax=[Candida] railenensis TaxID=45579 RepID=A0A9P0QJZ5_9ASCO|nr:leucine--tRNA ligase, mitochondrial [[Candida] railenensis]
MLIFQSGSISEKFFRLNIKCIRYLSPSTRSSSSSSPVNFPELDKKWIEKWKSMSQDGKTLHPTKHTIDVEKAETFYSLSMFPYPSGILHMGHLRVYSVSDVIARFKRLQGFNVIHPMGWDAFGLPAENAAVERGIDPSIWTTSNIAKMKEQMELMLADFDWEREVTTCSPDYYKWTQKIFLLLHEHGLAYRKTAEINWDPVDQTVLANEQVDSEGRSWRSGAIVEKRNLEQWFIGITKFAKDLNKDLNVLQDWPEKVKLMQSHWIGESHGAEIKFPIINQGSENNSITVFTSRPDTLFSVQFLALAIDHPIIQKASETDPELREFILLQEEKERENGSFDSSKDGYKLLDTEVKIPIDVNGQLNSEENTRTIPVYAAPFVLGSYGHGAVMGCPGHDQRDYDFWNFNSPEEPIVVTCGPKKKSKDSIKLPFTDKKGVLYDSSIIQGNISSLGKYNKLATSQAGVDITKDLEVAGLGSKSTQYRIRDWLISRQRYWGAPIPFIHCESCGPVPVPEADLPVLLPELNSDNVSKTFGKGNPLKNLDSFVNTKCPSCGSEHAKRDTDTMDTFMDSSWYFFRYVDAQNKDLPFSFEKATKNMPIDMYLGGVEHAILHLLYSRFISKFLGSIGMWDGSHFANEPIRKLVTQGMVHGKTYRDPKTGRCLKPDEVSSVEDPLISYEKMSKSKYNGADPGDCIAKYGADATRAHMLFSAPLHDVLVWNEEQIAGVDRWLRKVFQLNHAIKENPMVEKINNEGTVYNNIALNGKSYESITFNDTEFQLFDAIQKTIVSVTRSIEKDLSFNTIISDYMKLTNNIISSLKSNNYVNPNLVIDAYKNLLIIISPVTPCTADECWEQLHMPTQKGTIFSEKWPTPQVVESPYINYNVFVNGKHRFVHKGLKSLISESNDSILKELYTHEKASKFIVGDIKKLIVKPGTLSLICK